MSQAKGSPAPSRLQTGATTTTSSTSRPNTNATAPLLPPILEPHYYYTTTAPAASSSLISGSNTVGQVEDPRPSGVRKTSSQIQSRLGFFSAPDEPRSVGSHGYLSPSYSDLRPAGPPRQAPSHKTATTGTSVSGLRPLRNGTSLLSEKDMQFLKERDADNQQVFDVWSQRKHLELQMEREELDRRKAESQARYEAREQQITDANNTAVKYWEQRKVKQQKADAEDSYLKQIKLRALQVYHDRMNHAYDAKCKRREDGFAVRSGVAHIPQSFDAFRAQQRASKKSAAANPHQPVGKDGMPVSYRSLLEEADREGDQEAALIAMMGGTHPLVAIARQKSADLPASPSAAAAVVVLEPSFASAARQGSSGNLLPPLHHHLVSPTVLAQYLPPAAQASKASESGGLGAERSAAAARRSGGEEGDYDYAYDDDDDGEGSADGEPAQGILPPNITSIYAPREVIGAIVQQELDQAQDEFGHRLKAVAEDSRRRMEAAYQPVTPASAVAVAASDMDQTAVGSGDAAAMLHVSPAFFAAYGGTGSGDGAAASGEGAAGGGGGAVGGGSGRSSPTASTSEQRYSDERFSSAGASQQDSVVYSRSASGSGLGPLLPVAQSSAASLSRRESSGSRASTSGPAAVTSAAAAVPGSASGRREFGEISPVASESVRSEAVSDVASESRMSRRESAVSRTTSVSAAAPAPAADGPLEALGPSRRESELSRASSAASTGPAAATASGSGGRLSRRESSVAKAASGISLPAVEEDVPSAAPSRQESELSRAATDAGGPSRSGSAARGAAVTGAAPSRRESERSRAATDAAAPSRRDSAASGAAVSGAAPSRRESAAHSSATEGPAPEPSAARAGGSRREGSSTSTSEEVPAKDTIPPSRRESGPSLSVSGSSEVPALDPAPAANASRPASSASGLSVPRSESVVGGRATASGGGVSGGLTQSGGLSTSESGRRSSSPVGVEPSLALLPLAPVPVQPGGVGTNGAGKGTGSGDSDDEDDDDEEEEEADEPQMEAVEAPEKSGAEEETEEEDDDEQSSEEGSQTDEETEAEEEEEEEEDEEEEGEGEEEEEAGLSSEVDTPKKV